MTLKKISEILNSTIVPNVMGAQAEPIAEDLSNIVDFGTKVAELSAEQLKDYSNTFVAGVLKTYFDERKYAKVTPDIFIDSVEYGGVIQSVKAKLLTSKDSDALSLVNGQSYDAHKYYGLEVNAKIYEKDTSFMIPYSIPTEQYRQAFTSAEGVQGLVSLIMTCAENTLNRDLNALSMRVLNGMILSAVGTREVKLVSTYNSLHSASLTPATALDNYEFLQWAAGVIIQLRKAVQTFNTKYNDGTIECFTPEEDTRVTLLSIFSTSLSTHMEASTFHKELVSVGKYNTVGFWQAQGTTLIPDLAVCGKIVGKTKAGAPEDTTIANVVGTIYDKLSCGITLKPMAVRSDYTGSAGFYTYYMDNLARYFIDTRNTAIVLTLN